MDFCVKLVRPDERLENVQTLVKIEPIFIFTDFVLNLSSKHRNKL